jgi:hypothetical protein
MNGYGRRRNTYGQLCGGGGEDSGGTSSGQQIGRYSFAAQQLRSL